MTTFRLAYFAVLAAACNNPPPAQSPRNIVTPPPKLGPDLARIDFDARLADHRLHTVDAERLPDASDDTMDAMTGHAPAIRVDGDILAALACRPGGEVPSLISDDHYLYVVFASMTITMPSDPSGRMMPIPTQSTYCSFQRFRIPATLAYGGVLRVK